MLPQDGADDFVFDKGLNAVEGRFDSLLAFIDLYAFQPLPFSPNTRVADTACDGRANGAGAWVDHFLGLDEGDTGGNQSVGDVEQPPRQPGSLLKGPLPPAL